MLEELLQLSIHTSVQVVLQLLAQLAEQSPHDDVAVPMQEF